MFLCDTFSDPDDVSTLLFFQFQVGVEDTKMELTKKRMHIQLDLDHKWECHSIHHRETLLHVRRICLRSSYLQHSFLLLRTRFCIAKTIRFSMSVSRTSTPHWPHSARLHHERLHNYRYGVILGDHQDLDDQRWDTAWTDHLGSVRCQMHWSWSSMLVDRLRTRTSNDPSSRREAERWHRTARISHITSAVTPPIFLQNL